MRAADRSALIFVALLWGVNFVAAKAALEAFTLWELRVITFGGAAVLLFVVALCTRARLRIGSPRDLIRLLVAGTFGIGGFGLFSALALLHTTAGRATICVYTMPLWVVLLARFVLHEPLTAKRMCSLVLGAVGLAILAWPLLGGGEWLGPLFALAAAVSWAVGTVYLKRIDVDAPPITTTTWQLVAATAVSLVGLVLDPRDSPFEMIGSALVGLAYNALLGTVVAYVIWFGLLQRISAGAAGLGSLLVPLFGVAASFVLLGEIPTIADIAGLVLILTAASIPLVTRATGSDSRVAAVDEVVGASDERGVV